jgi:hypothetical protein
LIDTENEKFEINGENVSECSFAKITCINGFWSVEIRSEYYEE